LREAAGTQVPLTRAAQAAKASISVPSQAEVLALAVLTLLIFMISIGFFTKFSNFFGVVDNSGDSLAYMNVAAAIRHWNFHGLFIKQFWGLPYAMAAISIVTRISDHWSLLLVCLSSSVVSVALAYRLWGGWVAGFFAVLNFDWMQRSCLGGFGLAGNRNHLAVAAGVRKVRARRCHRARSRRALHSAPEPLFRNALGQCC
jgi:hypothetical protein